MKKSLTFLSIIACLLLCIFGCADVNGLHNQEAAMVTFVFKNFPETVDGEYTIPGNFNNWDNTKSTIKLTAGNGSDAGTMHNFYIDGLDLSAGEITLVIDGSAAVATPVVE